MTQLAGKWTLSLIESDGSTRNLSADLANIVETVTPPPIVVPPTPPEPTIPSTALVLDMLKATGWAMNHDLGTPGKSSGVTSYPATAPDGTQNCRLFDFKNSGGGGEIYHLHALTDSTPFKNFCVEVEEILVNPLNVTNLEIDIEQVDVTGAPLDMASQEDGYNGVFDVTENHKWVGTGIKVNPSAYAPNSHHTKKIYFVNSGGGTVTYPGVNLDGTWHAIGAKAGDVDNAKWTPKMLNLQVQFDSRSSVEVEGKVYFAKLNIYCW